MSGVDGKGEAKVPVKTPGDAVDVNVRSDVPGGESKKGAGIKMEGPNKMKGGKK